MKHYHIVTCPFCNCDDLVKNGHSENKTQRWLCNGCKKSFQLEYTYNAYNPGVKEKIVELTLNSSGVRDISRTLKINKNTVMSEFKKKEPAKVNPYLLDLEEINKLNKLDIVFHYTAEMDEFWSFVENKSNQRWTWYAMEKHTGIIISWHNGKRTDEDFKIWFIKLIYAQALNGF